MITPATAIANATNGSAVKVTLTLQHDAGVLIAPAEALVSRLDGSYAVQVQTSDGTIKWLTVDLLGVSGANVAIRGDGLSEGTVLLLPVYNNLRSIAVLHRAIIEGPNDLSSRRTREQHDDNYQVQAGRHGTLEEMGVGRRRPSSCSLPSACGGSSAMTRPKLSTSTLQSAR